MPASGAAPTGPYTDHTGVASTHVLRNSSEGDRHGHGEQSDLMADPHSPAKTGVTYAQDHDDDDDDGEEERQELFSDRASPQRESPAGIEASDEGGDSHLADPVASEAIIFADRPQHRSGGMRDRGRKRRGTPWRTWEIAKEALPTLVLSLLSLMFSGELLVHLARWPVFLKVDKLFILIPILLNLKGNLEMNLSLRMSTSANIGELDIWRTRKTLIVGNMTLLQVQALIVSAAASVLAFLLGLVSESPADTKAPSTAIPSAGVSRGLPTLLLRTLRPRSTPPHRLQSRRIIHHHPKPPADPALRLRNGYFEFVLVLATGMLSASLSSAVLGHFMCALVVVARRVGANPDNIASPLAASLGDLLTLTVVGLLASFLVRFEGTILATLIFVGLLLACAVCFYFTLKNTYVKELLSSGWTPLIIAMFISSGAGLVLDSFVLRYEGFALLAPVVTGLPGACAAILVSRTSTALHSGKGEIALGAARAGRGNGHGNPGYAGYAMAGGTWSDGRGRKSGLQGWISRVSTKIAGVVSSSSSSRQGFALQPVEGWLVPTTLLLIGVSIEALFLCFVWASGQMSFGWPFVLSFTCVGVLAVGFALFVAHAITLALWARDYDPDIYCLPYVSSIVDVAGQALLVLAFALANFLGDHITASVNAGEGHGGV